MGEEGPEIVTTGQDLQQLENKSPPFSLLLPDHRPTQCMRQGGEQRTCGHPPPPPPHTLPGGTLCVLVTVNASLRGNIIVPHTATELATQLNVKKCVTFINSIYMHLIITSSYSLLTALVLPPFFLLLFPSPPPLDILLHLFPFFPPFHSLSSRCGNLHI